MLDSIEKEVRPAQFEISAGPTKGIQKLDGDLRKP
jgi:hypothetical protein